jgi:chemotaxis methyl-accepting protein methylase
MKAENMIRESLGQSMAYTDTEFFREAAELERLAHEVMQS